MAFEKRSDNTSGEQFKFNTNGDTITGYYMGSEDFQGNFAPTKKHLFKTDKGLKVVFGQTHLGLLLASEQVGVLVRATLVGTKKTKKGGTMKTFQLEVDESNVIDPSDTGVAEATSYADDDAGDDETPMDEVRSAAARPAPVSAPSASTKSRVEGLLGKRKTA